SILLAKSSNNFGSLVPATLIEQVVVATGYLTTTEDQDTDSANPQPQESGASQLLALTVFETAAVFNIVLHVIYE
ncbi:hypothetical protein FRC01_013474, partial [Tulasnella sp. 417]